jgi:hypothetical protein
VLTVHGLDEGGLVFDPAQANATLDHDVVAHGGLAVDCTLDGVCPELRDTTGALRDMDYRFLQDHPYGVASHPYAGGLPDVFPAECKVVVR